MALETLKGLTEIGGYKIHEVEWNHPEDHFIEINNDSNCITFKIQDGPVKEAGLNGCQLDTLIEVAVAMLYGLNNNFPCRENSIAITHLETALLWLGKRKSDREARGVEGKSEA